MGVIRRWWPVLAVAILLTGVGVAASTAALPLTTVDSAGSGRQASPSALPRVPSTTTAAAAKTPGTTIPQWVVWLGLGLAVAAVLIVLFVVAGKAMRSGSRFRRRSLVKTAPVVAADQNEVVAAVEAGLEELDDADADPRRAVIACWVRLERAARAAGTAREPGDTPADLVLRLLAGHELSSPILDEFADVYRIARYAARHEIDAGMRDRARAALIQLRGQLAGAPA